MPTFQTYHDRLAALLGADSDKVLAKKLNLHRTTLWRHRRREWLNATTVLKAMPKIKSRSPDARELSAIALGLIHPAIAAVLRELSGEPLDELRKLRGSDPRALAVQSVVAGRTDPACDRATIYKHRRGQSNMTESTFSAIAKRAAGTLKAPPRSLVAVMPGPVFELLMFLAKEEQNVSK